MFPPCGLPFYISNHAKMGVERNTTSLPKACLLQVLHVFCHSKVGKPLTTTGKNHLTIVSL
jgi:hypothetical protein